MQVQRRLRRIVCHASLPSRVTSSGEVKGTIIVLSSISGNRIELVRQHPIIIHIVPGSWDRFNCPNYRGGAISGSEVLLMLITGHIKVSLIQECPHFKGLKLKGFHCILQCV